MRICRSPFAIWLANLDSSIFQFNAIPFLFSSFKGKAMQQRFSFWLLSLDWNDVTSWWWWYLHCVSSPIRKSNLFVTFERQKSSFNICLGSDRQQTRTTNTKLKSERRVAAEGLKRLLFQRAYSAQLLIFAHIKLKSEIADLNYWNDFPIWTM